MVHQELDKERNKMYRKILFRLLPFLMILYVIAYIDRANVGFAKLQFLPDLGFNETIFGIGGGIFYLGYIMFEVPSNLLLDKIGVRLTLLRIMIIWGLCCAAMAFMTIPIHYYSLRFLLGAAEAGFFPGILLYLTYWVPGSRRAQFTALFMFSMVIAGIVGGPLSGAIMHWFDGVNGIRGWRWLFILEGLPACMLGVVAYFYLKDKPADAHWLTDSEKEILENDLQADVKKKGGEQHKSFWLALKNPQLYCIVGMALAVLVSTNGIQLWLPTILKKAGIINVSNNGYVSAIPYLFAGIVQYLVARHSDKTGERRWHVAICIFIASIGWFSLAYAWEANNPILSVILLSITACGTFGAMGPFWTIPGTFLSGKNAAGGIALVTTMGGIGNFFSPILVGWLKTLTGSLKSGQLFYAGMALIGGLSILLLGYFSTSKQDIKPNTR